MFPYSSYHGEYLALATTISYQRFVLQKKTKWIGSKFWYLAKVPVKGETQTWKLMDEVKTTFYNCMFDTQLSFLNLIIEHYQSNVRTSPLSHLQTLYFLWKNEIAQEKRMSHTIKMRSPTTINKKTNLTPC